MNRLLPAFLIAVLMAAPSHAAPTHLPPGKPAGAKAAAYISPIFIYGGAAALLIGGLVLARSDSTAQTSATTP